MTACVRWLSVVCVGAAAWASLPATETITDAFIEHLESAQLDKRVAAVTRDRVASDPAWAGSPTLMVTALAEIFPDFRSAVAAWDRGDLDDAVQAFARLVEHDDPYLSATSHYLHARVLADQGEFEAAEAALAQYLEGDAEWLRRTPFNRHAFLLLAACREKNLRHAAATATLTQVEAALAEAAEPVVVGHRALQRALENRSDHNLQVVHDLMSYASNRLEVGDASGTVRDRQRKIIALLDELVEQEQQRENQGKGQQGGCKKCGDSQCPGGKQCQGKKPGQSTNPANPAEESTERGGQGNVGELDESPEVDPAESWGKLPEREREQILQSLRERYPSRYRQLVEQYYRALAEDN